MAAVNMSRTGVEKLLARLNPAKASGPDELSARFLKETAAQISPMYAFLFHHVLEHIIVSQMRDHTDQHNILIDCQHGFRSRHSCESQLIVIVTVHDLASSLNQKHQTDMAIMDISKVSIVFRTLD